MFQNTTFNKIKTMVLIACLAMPISTIAQQTVTDSLVASLCYTSPDTNKVIIYNNLLKKLFSNYPDSALDYGKEGLTLARRLNYTKGVSQLINNIGVINYLKGRYPEAITYYNKSLVIEEKTGNKLGVAQSYNNIATVWYAQGNYQKSLEYHNRALEIKIKIKDRASIAKTLNNIGNIHNERGNYPKALEYYLESQKIKEQVKDTLALAQTLANISTVYVAMSNDSLAMERNQQALILRRKIDDKNGIASSLLMLGDSYFKIDSLDSAEELYRESIAIYTKLGNQTGISDGLSNVGNVLGKKGHYNDAIRYAKSALKIKKKIGAQKGIGNLYELLAKLHYTKHKYKLTILYSDSSVRIADQLKSGSLVLDNYGIRHKAFNRMKQMDSAYIYSQKMFWMYDSLKSKQNGKMVLEMQAQFDSEKKDQQILLLEKNNEIQALGLRRQRIIRNTTFLIALLALGLAAIAFYSYHVKKRSNTILEKQRSEIEKQKQAITDSITYARQIQAAMLPPNELLNKLSKNHLVYYKPRDIVSGDFYWMQEIKDEIAFAVADSTGHGVPGAFMSMLGISFLNDITGKMGYIKPNAVLNELRLRIKDSLRQTGKKGEQQDGIDMAFCTINKRNLKLKYAGAHIPLWLLRNGELRVIKATRNPVGVYRKEIPFELHEIYLVPGDSIYLFSDGFADQISQKNGKKYKTDRLKKFILSISHLPIKEQLARLNIEFLDWKGNERQVDDVLVVSVKI